MDQDHRQDYAKPEILKLANIRDITFVCPEFSCSVFVPPPPPPPPGT